MRMGAMADTGQRTACGSVPVTSQPRKATWSSFPFVFMQEYDDVARWSRRSRIRWWGRDGVLCDVPEWRVLPPKTEY